jgi:hypothetical protein
MFKIFAKKTAPASAPKPYPIGASSTKPYPIYVDSDGKCDEILGFIPKTLTDTEIDEMLKDAPELPKGEKFNIYNLPNGFAILTGPFGTQMHSSLTIIGGQKVLTNGDHYFDRDIRQIMKQYWDIKLQDFANDAGDLVDIDNKLFLNNDNNSKDVRIRFIADTFFQVHAAISVGIGYNWEEVKVNDKKYYIAF